VYYESDPQALEWLEQALNHPSRRVRVDAVHLLAAVDCANRMALLTRAQRDGDSYVAATAGLIEAQVRVAPSEWYELFESDFGSGLDASDLDWEWEYAIAVCHGSTFPGALTVVWSKPEDDALARRFAVMKTYAGKAHEAIHATPIIVSKRLVTRFTRSPKSSREAREWHLRGRPPYGGP